MINIESNKINFEKWLEIIGMFKIELEDGSCFASTPNGYDTDIQWNNKYVYGEDYKYKYSEIENISKKLKKDLKGITLNSKQSYKQFLNVE